MQIVGPRLRTSFSEDEALPSQPARVLPTELTVEWNAVAREHCNVLVEALPALVGPVLAELRPHLRAPIHEYSPDSGVPVPEPTEGTLILLEVASLVPRQQAKLLRWLNDRKGRVQVASTSSEPLFPLVERGTFDAALYYRLNIVRIAI
jgi:sigma-54-interacting transcriptional regulator